jgi:hypothetical protein
LIDRFLKACLIPSLAGLLLLPALPARALETDQYLVWGEELSDSTDRVNEYLNQEIRLVLDRLARRGGERPIACEKIPITVYRHLFPWLISSKFRRFLHHDPEIERFPEQEVGYFKYLGESIYRKPAFPFFLPLGRTVKVNDVHVGIDKLGGHMFGFGRRYYKRYLQELRRGASEEEAMERAILWGLEVERFFVGGLVDGVVSLGDLEANFWGMMLARNFCGGPEPHLALQKGRWVLARPVDLRDYVGPRFDESYYGSLYLAFRWKRVRPVLEEEYCPVYRNAEVRELLSSYERRDRSSLSQKVVQEYFAARDGRPSYAHTLPVLCDSQVSPGGESQQRSAEREPPAGSETQELELAGAPCPFGPMR